MNACNMKTLTPADIGIITAAFDDASALGDDEAIDTIKWAALENGVTNGEQDAFDLAYDFFRLMAKN